MKKRYQVFVSSTYRDLIEERATIMDTLLKADCIPAGMELFPASDESQWKVIQRVIDESDYYVVVIAGKYGTEYKGKSFTQREYEYAISKKKSIIALLHKNPEELPLSKCEKSESKQNKLKEFRRLTQKRLCDFWTTKDDLSTILFHSINNLKSRHPKDGWIKASKYNLKKLSERRNKNLIKENGRLKERIQRIEFKQKKEDIKTVIEEKIKEIDESINSLFPEKVYSPRFPSNQLFSSQLLINSMMSMGIPLNVTLNVLESCIPEIIGLKRQVAQLETSHIRKAVASSLYKLDQDMYSEEQIQAWGDSYVRKYGNPNIRPLVLMDVEDNTHHEIEPLTYKFVKRKLVPALIETVIGSKSFKYLLKSVRKKEDARIADVIIKSVKNLDVSRIHYSTLLALAKDLALQPPHPWLVPKAFDFKSILYDYERASNHAINVKKVIEYGNFDSGKYPLRECVHHSCSGILAVYGVFMGCGYLSPLYNLTYQLNQIIQNRAQDVLEYSKIGNLKHDLFLMEIELSDFHKDLVRLRDDVDWKNPLSGVDSHLIFSDILYLYKIFHTIFTNYYTSRVPDFGFEIKELLTSRFTGRS